MLAPLFRALAEAFDGNLAIERAAARALRHHADRARLRGDPSPLPATVLQELARPEAHPVCHLLPELPLAWAPPTTSRDPKYLALSDRKVHVELIGPEGLSVSDDIRLGLYGIVPHSEYGIRTHPAEEVFVMLAGQCWWQRHPADYAPAGVGERSHHPSMLPHGTRTGDRAFLSAYAWTGDISTENYVFVGSAPGEGQSDGPPRRVP